MKKLSIFIFMYAMAIGFACERDNDVAFGDNDYFIFGRFYGMCAGEQCVEVYKVTKSSLYEDLSDNYLLNDFDFISLSNSKFLQVRDLVDDLPNQLLLTDESFFGCPDCADQGGIFIQLSRDGIVKSWKIDQRKQDIPGYLHDFVNKVNEKINLLHD